MDSVKRADWLGSPERSVGLKSLKVGDPVSLAYQSAGPVAPKIEPVLVVFIDPEKIILKREGAL